MTERDRIAFGVSPGIREGDRHAFVEVLGEVDGGNLRAIRNAKEEFPNVGNVYVRDEHWIPARGICGIWRVRSMRSIEPGIRQSEYSSVERGRALPVEIVTLDIKSDSPEEVYAKLTSGITLDHNVFGLVLVQLADGVVLGPIRCEPVNDDHIAVANPEAFNDCIGRWPDSTALSPISFQVEGVRRTFTSLISIPKSPSTYDCAEIGYAFRSLVRLSRDAIGNSPDVTKKQIDALSRAVSELTAPDRLTPRIERVKKAIDSTRVGRENLIDFVNYLKDQPPVRDEIIAEIARAKEEAKTSLDEEASSLSREIEALRTSKKKYERELLDIKGTIAEAEVEYSRVVGAIQERIAVRIEELRTKPAQAVADVLVLEALMQHRSPAVSRDSTQLIDRPRLERLDRPKEVVSVINRQDVLQILKENLMAAGLSSGSAKRLAPEILAAAQAGQLVSFSGSMASTVARTSAQTFSGANSVVFAVPVGMLGPEPIRSVLDEIQYDTEGAHLASLVLEGMNRSAFEAYGEDLRALITRSQLTLGAAGSRVVVFGTLASGPSCLSTSPSQCELGPILETDTLSLTPQFAAGNTIGGEVEYDRWRTWLPDADDFAVLPNEIEDLERKVEGVESILWRRCVRNASTILQAFERNGASTPLQSLAFGWLIPRASASEIEGTTFTEQLLLAANSTQPDPRIPKLLSRLFPSQELPGR
jgi:hypothetical protein